MNSSSSAKVSISPSTNKNVPSTPEEDEYSDPGTMRFSSTLMQRSRAESDNYSVESTPEVTIYIIYITKSPYVMLCYRSVVV